MDPATHLPEDVQAVHITSTFDGTPQPAMFYAPPGPGPAPLACTVHSWSSTYDGANFVKFYEQAKQRGMVFIYPHFRGPNTSPETCLSPMAQQDILDAVDYAREHASVDPARIYCVGNSGGGFTSLMMAARVPELWRAVFASCGIADLAQWYRQCVELWEEHGAEGNRRYASDMEAICGGAAGASSEVDAQYEARSPLPILERARGVDIHISHGLHDGHPGTGVVPVDHSLRAFNRLAQVNGHAAQVLTEEQIRALWREERVPEDLQTEAVADPLYTKPVMFQRQAGPVTLTLFDGNHEILVETAFAWLDAQR
jgi:dipeptidyl aminopeptidase/acylaminoacyl peptidase